MTVKNSIKGFTLIELLIVVAILGILGAILFVAIGGNPQRDARDARRVADINQLQLALELFKNSDTNGYYPNSIAALAPVYIGGEPKDPRTGNTYNYAVNNSAAPTNYHLGATLEKPDNKSLCTDADMALADQSGWFPAGFAGNGTPTGAGLTACGGGSTGDADTPVYDVRS